MHRILNRFRFTHQKLNTRGKIFNGYSITDISHYSESDISYHLWLLTGLFSLSLQCLFRKDFSFYLSLMVFRTATSRLCAALINRTHFYYYYYFFILFCECIYRDYYCYFLCMLILSLWAEIEKHIRLSLLLIFTLSGDHWLWRSMSNKARWRK